MLTPPPRPPRRSRSPKEDGEIDETAQDAIVRKAPVTPGIHAIVKALREHSNAPKIFTPVVARMVGQMLSAALDPMPCKMDKKVAKELLNTIATEMLPARKRKFDEMAAEEKARLAQAAAAAAAALEAARFAHGDEVKARRPTVGSAEPVPRQQRNNHGYMYDA